MIAKERKTSLGQVDRRKRQEVHKRIKLQENEKETYLVEKERKKQHYKSRTLKLVKKTTIKIKERKLDQLEKNLQFKREKKRITSEKLNQKILRNVRKKEERHERRN